MGKPILFNDPLAYGSINLAAKDGATYKHARFCRTGKFKAMTGEVELTREDLEKIADVHNRMYANPENENAHVPHLKGHNKVDPDSRIGVALGTWTVEPWKDPKTGLQEFALYGDLRVDDDAAKIKVDKGLYSELSISFDDDSFETYEISSVGVGAANGSRILAQGDIDMSVDLAKDLAAERAKVTGLEAKIVELAASAGKLTNLAGKVKAQREARKAISLALGNVAKEAEGSITSLASMIKEQIAGLREAGIKNSLCGFMAEGKMTKAEFDKIVIKDLAAMDDKAVKFALESFSNRTADPTCVGQIGQSGAKMTDLSKASNAQVREMIAAQKAGKVSLAADDSTPKTEPGATGEDGKPKPENEGQKVNFAEMEDTMKKLCEMPGHIEKMCGHVKAMQLALSKLDESDKEEIENEK